MLGKRTRPTIRRTTSITEFTVDLPPINPSQPFDLQTQREHQKPCPGTVTRKYPATQSFDPIFLSIFSPRSRRNADHFVHSGHFLWACGLCNRRLVAGHDIYMYRGDTAFCSLECRQQQMNQDELKEKCSMASMKKEGPSTSGSEASSNGETMGAA
ncbi:FCS-Like Zinc finger 5-like [Tasmannia lanceolata]|uniref:FCS-Like Zinc finger 5-like n=1 Tax=Tasmannia lanceolata TaxID=3420 RepID=UPI004063167C